MRSPSLTSDHSVHHSLAASGLPRAAVCAAALGVLAVAVKAGGLRALDGAIAQQLAAIRAPWLDELMQAITFFGSSPWTIAMLTIMSWWWWRHHRRERIGVLWLAWLAGVVIQTGLRYGVAQWRPDTLVVPEATAWFARYDLAGFTSGHVYRSTFLFGWWAAACARQPAAWARWARLGSLALLVLVAGSRMYLNRHWCSDVVGAVLLAAGTLAVAWSLIDRRRSSV